MHCIYREYGKKRAVKTKTKLDFLNSFLYQRASVKNWL